MFGTRHWYKPHGRIIILVEPLDIANYFVTPICPESKGAIRFFGTLLADSIIIIPRQNECLLLFNAMMLEKRVGSNIVICHGDIGVYFYFVEDGSVK